MDKKCIIWGTGRSGECAYYKVKNSYTIIAFVDNNEKMWGQTFLGVSVIAPKQLMEIQPCEIIIASVYYNEIADQLIGMGIMDFMYIDKFSKLLTRNEFHLENNAIQRPRRTIKKVLFVQKDTCIRTYKIACMLKNRGITVDLAFLNSGPDANFKNMQLPWDRIIPINNILEFVDYVNKEDYDLVHQSNEPDILTNLLLHSNKKVVHDTHDLMSLRADITLDGIMCEFIANKYSAGNIYTTTELKDYAANKFDILNKKIFVLENMILENVKPKKYLDKLSKSDGEIHCVYEGGVHTDTTSTRYYIDKFLKLAENKVHIHFYSGNVSIDMYKELAANNYYIHYEGNKSLELLIEDMTKYDVGLLDFNITERNYKHLKSASPNKLYEYLLSGLPVATAKFPAYETFLAKYPVGKVLDWQKNIADQMKDIANISIPEEFLVKNKLTMDSNAESLVEFYENVAFG